MPFRFKASSWSELRFVARWGGLSLQFAWVVYKNPFIAIERPSTHLPIHAFSCPIHHGIAPTTSAEFLLFLGSTSRDQTTNMAICRTSSSPRYPGSFRSEWELLESLGGWVRRSTFNRPCLPRSQRGGSQALYPNTRYVRGSRGRYHFHQRSDIFHTKTEKYIHELGVCEYVKKSSLHQ